MRRLLKYLFGGNSRYRCSFCSKDHSEVANLIEGPGCNICNNCVKICSDVLMKQCAEYRESFQDTCSKTAPNAAPNGGSAIPPDNSAAMEGPPPVT